MLPVKTLSNRTCFIVNLRDRLACVGCGKQPTRKETYHKGFEYHHVMPRSNGGSDESANIVLLCHGCHRQQHGKSPPAMEMPEAASEKFACKACNATLNPHTIEMNCGWYCCSACREMVYLFDHFSFKSQP